MTKQVEMFLGETNNVEKKATKTIAETKKEGASFFDSILADAKSKSTTTKNESKTDLKNSDASSQATAEKTTTKGTATAKKEDVTQQNPTANSKTQVKDADIQDNEPATKPQEKKMASGSSLLDRMLVDAKTVIKQKSEDATQALKENKKADKVETKEDKTALIDEIKTAKQEKNDETSEVVTEDKKADKAQTKEDKAAVIDEIKTAKQEKSNDTSEAVKEEKKTNTLQTKEEKSTVADEIKTVQKQAAENASEVVNDETKASPQVNKDAKEVASNETKSTPSTTVQNNESKEVKVEATKNDKAELNTVTSKESQVSNKSTAEQKQSTTVVDTPLTKKAETAAQTQTKENKVDNSLIKDDKSVQLDQPESENVSKKDLTQTESSLKESKTVVNENSSKAEVNNQKVAQELAKLNANTSKEQTVDISKENLNNAKPMEEKKEKLSLLDKLVNETKEKLTTKEDNTLKTDTKIESKTVNNDVLTNIYLSSRNQAIEKNTMETHKKGKEQALNAKNVEDVKTSAKTLDLGLKETQVEVKAAQTSTSTQEASNLDKNLERLAFAKNVGQDDLDTLDIKSKKISKEASRAALGETVVNLNVNAQNVQNITHKIIGARQQMASMMSDIAKEMYTNYKPPITAFRLNLQPAHLGSIAIMIKSDRENAVSISMNMSNSATLDAMTDNQGSLRTALSKSFGEENSFELDFGMQDESKEQSGDQNQKNGQQQRQTHTSTEGLLEAREENKEEMLINYM